MNLHEITERYGPISSSVGAILLVILGIIVVTQPAVLPWLAGIALILAGAAVLVAVIVPGAGGIAHHRR